MYDEELDEGEGRTSSVSLFEVNLIFFDLYNSG